MTVHFYTFQKMNLSDAHFVRDEGRGCITPAKLPATERFDVLITDLHMPNAGDGFTVVNAMRHSQPNALTLRLSGYSDVQSGMAAILLEADEIIVKPLAVGKLAELVRSFCDALAIVRDNNLSVE